VRQALEGLSLNTICVEGRCPMLALVSTMERHLSNHGEYLHKTLSVLQCTVR